MTIKDLKSVIENLPDDLSVVIGTHGHFVYATQAEDKLATANDGKPVWVIGFEETKTIKEAGEFPLDESILNKNVNRILYIKW